MIPGPESSAAPVSFLPLTERSGDIFKAFALGIYPDPRFD